MPTQQDWETSTSDLIALYRGIERRSFDVPTFSIVPILLFLWYYFVTYIFFLIDIFIWNPINWSS